MSKKAPSVKGMMLSPRRVTGWGLWYGCVYVGVPLIGVLALVDVVMWAVFTFGLDRCYGVLCWL